MRYRNRFILFKNKYTNYKTVINTVLSKAGRNNTGTQTIYNRKFRVKAKSPVFNFYSMFTNRFFYLKWINTSTKLKKKYNIMSTWNNILFCLPNTVGSVIGTKYIIPDKYFVGFSSLVLGLPCLLKIIPNFFKISSLLHPTRNKPTYAVSSGCYSTKIPKKKKDKLLKLILPSKTIKFFKLDTLCFIGKNDCSTKKLLKPGKAGFNQNLGWKSSVRGVAMNPVDHPNGGRTKSCTPERSPWGWVAKLNK